MGGTASYDIQDGILDPVSPDLEQEYWFKRRTWYINEAGQFGWSKLELQRQIKSGPHLETALDLFHEVCYNEKNRTEVGEKAMIKILFICHGNICRSTMAEFVMKDLVKKAGLESLFHIESAATSTEEIGNPVYPSARRKLAEHGIDCAGKTARQLRYEDYSQYDLLIEMDQANIRNMHRICGGDFDGKMHLLMEFTDRPGDVADPWYTGDFESTWKNVLVGCRELLQAVKVGMGTGRVLYGEKEK